MNFDRSDSSQFFLAGFREPEDRPRRFSSGERCYLFDGTGRRCLDFSSQYWNVNLGAGHPALLQATHAAVNDHLFLNLRFGRPPAAEALAGQLSQLTGDRFPRIQFMTSGSMAVEAAIKVARQVTGRQQILSLRQSYHGMSLGALQATGYDDIVLPFGARDGRHIFAEPFQCSRCPFDLNYPTCELECAARLVDIIETKRESLAAVLAEPVISNQAIVPPDGFWPTISEACHRCDVLLVADEVVSGFGRLGDWLGCDLFGMKPDLVALGKGMGAGIVPIASLLHGGRTADFYSGKTLLHGQTFDGYDLGCRVALAVAEIIERDGLLARVDSLGAELGSRLSALAARIDPEATVRGRGLLWGLELSDGALPDEEIASFARKLQIRLTEPPDDAMPILLGGLGRVLIFAPAFVIEPSEIETGLALVEAALQDALPNH